MQVLPDGDAQESTKGEVAGAWLPVHLRAGLWSHRLHQERRENDCPALPGDLLLLETGTVKT